MHRVEGGGREESEIPCTDKAHSDLRNSLCKKQ